MLSLIVPVYRNEDHLPKLLDAVAELARMTPLEGVFVVDGSPDRSAEILRAELPRRPFQSRLIELSRNFGSFQAIAAGLMHGTGDYFAMLAADLQEPPEIILDFVERLESGAVDVVIGQRASRQDPFLSRVTSNVFWSVFRALAVKEMPAGGADTFACTRQVRDALVALPEINSSLISLLFWVGFRRQLVPFVRRARPGKSGWTFKKKLDYAIRSIFNFTDFPIRLLMYGGAAGALLAVLISALVIVGRFAGSSWTPGYKPLLLLIAFYGGIMTLGLGVVGEYVWFTLENSRRRPNYIVASISDFPGRSATRPSSVSAAREG